MKQLSTIFIAVVFGILLATEWHGSQTQVEGKMCQNLFRCMGNLFTIPFREIANATYYYTGSLLKLSEISEEDWESQMDILRNLCNIWLTFDNCMDPNWIDCIDWDQLSLMINLVGTSAVDPISNANSTVQNQRREEAVDKTRQRLDGIGWTREDTKKSMKIGSYVCQNINKMIPVMSCFRDLVMSNETMINTTIWTRSLSKVPGCTQGNFNCRKVEIQSKVIGNWLYHGCPTAQTEDLVSVVRAVMMGMLFEDNEQCQDLFSQTSEQLFSAPYPPEWAYNYGNDLSNCNISAVQMKHNESFNKYVTKFLTQNNLTKEEFYHEMACKHAKISLDQCDIWPMPTTPKTTTPTTTTTEAKETTKGHQQTTVDKDGPTRRRVLVRRTRRPLAQATQRPWYARQVGNEGNKKNGSPSTIFSSDDSLFINLVVALLGLTFFHC